MKTKKIAYFALSTITLCVAIIGLTYTNNTNDDLAIQINPTNYVHKSISFNEGIGQYVSNSKAKVDETKNSIRFISAVKVDMNDNNELSLPGTFGFHIEYEKTIDGGTTKVDKMFDVDALYYSYSETDTNGNKTIYGTELSSYYNNHVGAEFKAISEYINDSSTSYNLFMTVEIRNIPTSDFDKPIKVQPYCLLKDGTYDLAKEAECYTIAVKPDFIINKTGYTKNVDYTHMDDKVEAYLQTAAVSSTDNPHAFAMFNASGTKYYAEATVSMIRSSDDAWARFGIGSATDDSNGNARAFFFSPKEGQKIVMMDVPNGWGAITAQSMIWQANGINTMDPTNLKLGILRDGDNFYYLLNDKLYWFETNTKFHDVNTYPTIVAKDTQINITDWSVTLDNAQIAAKLDLPTMKQVFFNADTNGRVNFESDSKFSISGGDTFQNAAVKPIGDKALLKGNFAIEFDLSNVGSDNANDNNNRIGVALRQVGIENPYISDSFAMTNNGAEAFDYRIFKWNGGDHTYWATQNEATRASGATVEGHYKIVRTINGNSASLVLYFNNAEVLNVTTSYIGDYHPIFGANYASGTFNNVTFYGIE